MNGIPEYFRENVLTVSEINGLIKEVIESIPVFSSVKLRGEISNFKNHRASGHFYFTLKDDSSAIKAVMFRGNNMHLRFVPEDGMRVIATGRIGVYDRDGAYQLYVSEMEPDGIGALYIAYERLKARLAEEGLFSPERKKPLPKYPRTIGIVTSPTGAAVRDMINVTGRRYPLAEIKLFPALVQGDGAEPSLIAGIEYFNRENNADVIIIGRGGGSIEDLWAFNGEGLARAVAASVIPVISAVGHETDFTICDLAADMRAPTPSAAAELAVPDRDELKRHLAATADLMEKSVLSHIAEIRARVKAAADKKVLRSPESFIDYKKEQIDRVSERLFAAWDNAFERRTARLSALSGKLDALSPLSVLGRGFGAAFDTEGRLLTKSEQLPKGKQFALRLSDGTVNAVSEGEETR